MPNKIYLHKIPRTTNNGTENWYIILYDLVSRLWYPA